MNYDLKPGDKVVCIYDFSKNSYSGRLNLKFPKYHETYTVRELDVAFSPQLGHDDIGLRLVEITNDKYHCNAGNGTRVWMEPLFTPIAFRPLGHETTMQIFYDILANPDRHITGHSKLDVRYESPSIKKKNGTKK